MQAQDSKLAELTLAANNADISERIHHNCCRQWRAMLDCASCQHHAAEVLRTDIAIRDHFQGLCQEVA